MSEILNSKVNSTKKIASALVNYAETFSFVIRDGNPLSGETVALLETLLPYLIESKKVSEWPGTKLFWESATLYTYYLNDETAYLIYSSEERLFNWVLPHRPEDLVFYKNDKPLFVSITHERDAYFALNAGEDVFLRDRGLI